ncbi:MAG: TonB-dependent receptor, partial [Sulfurimonas sp.]|nr:TonB-dependent receptor [Sulfurimonas sp.]
NLKLRGALSEDDFVAFTFSKRKIDNSWRDHNKFDSTQATLKYGHMFEDDSTLETEFSYTESNMQLPATMNASEFETFKETGSQHNTSSQWQNSGRDSKIFSINAKYEKEVGNTTFKPRIYFNTWEHFHPVTGMINDSNDNSVYGTDLELNNVHKLFGQKATFVAGVTLKADITNGAEKYKYADIVTAPKNLPYPPFTAYDEIQYTTSDNKGDLAQTEDSTTILYGGYIMETFSPSNDFIIDVSTRVDKLSFDISGNEISDYDYSFKRYINGKGLYNIDKSYTLFSAKLGVVYKISKTTNIYASVATGNQAPTTSELGENESLNKATSVNYEVGLKTRAKNFSADVAIYQNDVDDEIIQIKDANGNSIYDNAGKTQKRGLEVTAVYKPIESVQLGANYAYSDFKFVKFNESVSGSLVSRDGNYLPYIPKNMYSLFATYNMKNGFKSRISTKSWGKYFMDNANTQEYDGYKFVTDIMLGYEKDAHNIQLNINNITNQYYAMEALKDVYGNESYKAAAPVNGMLTYIYKF